MLAVDMTCRNNIRIVILFLILLHVYATDPSRNFSRYSFYEFVCVPEIDNDGVLIIKFTEVPMGTPNSSSLSALVALFVFIIYLMFIFALVVTDL
ncbi:unnamed protein product [Caenorhabditis bovis]|uniref:G-protein coupled receptors family 1 profile domain-containing protein n=1 Tax=Caenorhabditis bovis TaxID=2654633 RepID=A0A8S1F9G6_9PELO|nr:unnamed protein product [Caenorhabditis bovis]